MRKNNKQSNVFFTASKNRGKEKKAEKTTSEKNYEKAAGETEKIFFVSTNKKRIKKKNILDYIIKENSCKFVLF